MKSFSQRQGLERVRDAIQTDSMDDALRTGLWNEFTLAYGPSPVSGYLGAEENTAFNGLAMALWRDFFRSPVDRMGISAWGIYDRIRDWYFKAAWNRVYDFVEFVVNVRPRNMTSEMATLDRRWNAILEREMSAWRFVDRVLTPISSEEEVSAIQDALAGTESQKPTNIHLRTALGLLSDRTAPDFRNSIKESISAVEAGGVPEILPVASRTQPLQTGHHPTDAVWFGMARVRTTPRPRGTEPPVWVAQPRRRPREPRQGGGAPGLGCDDRSAAPRWTHYTPAVRTQGGRT